MAHLLNGFAPSALLKANSVAKTGNQQPTGALAPVFVGDAIWATVEVTDIKPTSKHGRAVLTSQVEIYNQKNETVISYRITRLLAGRSADDN